MDFSLILLNTSCGIYSISKQSKYKVFLSINNETHYVPLLCLSLIFITYTSSYVLDKSSLDKTLLNLSLLLMYLVILILVKGFLSKWSVLLYLLPALVNPFHRTSSLKVMLSTEECHLLPFLALLTPFCSHSFY